LIRKTQSEQSSCCKEVTLLAGLSIILLRLQVDSKTLVYALQYCLLAEVMCHADILPCIEWPFNCLSVLSGVPPVYAPKANMKSMKGGAEPVLSSVYHFSD